MQGRPQPPRTFFSGLEQIGSELWYVSQAVKPGILRLSSASHSPRDMVGQAVGKSSRPVFSRSPEARELRGAGTCNYSRRRFWQCGHLWAMPCVRLESISTLTSLLLSIHALPTPPSPDCVSGCFPTRESAFGKTRTDTVLLDISPSWHH